LRVPVQVMDRSAFCLSFSIFLYRILAPARGQLLEAGGYSGPGAFKNSSPPQPPQPSVSHPPVHLMSPQSRLMSVVGRRPFGAQKRFYCLQVLVRRRGFGRVGRRGLKRIPCRRGCPFWEVWRGVLAGMGVGSR